ncbi:MAG: glyceraldehyde 3-phosphate dehydrogenase NAD-binding domain-containing protein, partial [Peptostreptococcus porci]|nr:glyceraldehyde 3-phosphate dehydrogenase NAD-binding domain-containing protein [Peptostreptococcus porci]
MVKVAINGFGRIGRLALRKMMEQTDKFEVVAINDLTDAHMLAHLFKYDTSQGRFNGEIQVEEGAFIVNGKEIMV